MVKAQKSGGRKSTHCLRGQAGGQTEMDDSQLHLDTQHPPQAQSRGGNQSFDPVRLQTSASAGLLVENCSQKDNLEDQEKDDGSFSQSQTKSLWRPIPPLLPEAQRTAVTVRTREQSCQTDYQQLQTSACNLGRNGTGLCEEPGDPPLLQQPLQTSKSGIQQIIECFRSGTSQLRHMLLREVDTIFECKLCHSLFRGLPNLITHKEYYCLSRLPESDGDDRQGLAMKDLLDTIFPRTDRPDFVVRLEPIQTTTKAVFQYLTTEEDLSRYPPPSPSARESPVAWEGEPGEGVENNQPTEPAASDSHNSPAPNQGQKKREAEEETKEETSKPEDEGSNSGVEDVTISCCLCGQDFNSRRSIRRHCRKMHQTKLEELRKFTETRTVPTSLLSMVKGRPRTLSTPTGKSCPLCLKTFATKANVRRHFDEVHRGLQRDSITPSIASRPGQPFTLDVAPPKKSSSASPTRSHKSTPADSKTTPSTQASAKTQSQQPSSAPTNTTSCRCTLCKRTYSSQLMLKRHMRIVHKIYSVRNKGSGTTTPTPTEPTPNPSSSSSNVGTSSNNIRVKEEAVEPSVDDNNDDDDDDDDDDADVESSPAQSPSDSTGAAKGSQVVQNPLKVKEEEAPLSPKMTSSSSSRGSNAASAGAAPAKMTKLSVGFDFKQLFCKLCKRQFSSRQNLTKHIELHTDGNDIFIKFYRCPLCRYESRRKRDVLRHVTVVHKKPSAFLAKIMPKLENRAVKRLAEVVLSTNGKRTGGREEVNGRQASAPTSSSPPLSPPVTRKQDCPTANASSSSHSTSAPPPAQVTRKQQELSSPPFTPSPPITRKQEREQGQQLRPISPPLTRRSDKLSNQRTFPNSSSNSQPSHSRRHDAQSESSSGTSSSEVKVTKNFSLHACDQCGRAFAKKLYLESHKRSHRNAPTTTASRRKGVNTRSKSLVW
ncbi:zinc finger protein 800b isoform X2 [Gouania willdenowi]|nr:zinc finger protein 800 isoform X2 [Gouania willdenowi]XP_028307349.1 zinc finger protein 800 isoform X2 [Gouania willdenowi]